MSGHDDLTSTGVGTAGSAMMRLFGLLVALSAASGFSAEPVRAQTDARLVEIIRHAQEGQGDSARIKVQRLLSATPPSDTLYPQILYTQAMVAGDAGEMRRLLQRVAVEHSSSSWADDAVLRLVQLDYASGNLDGAAKNLERIRLDYPGSQLLPQASYWAARTYFDQRKPELACRWLAEGMAGAQGNIELQNQLRYLNQRCSQYAASGRPLADSQPATPAGPDTSITVGSALPDTARPTVRPDTVTAPSQAAPVGARADTTPTASPSPAAARRFRVQVTAVRTRSTAQSIAAKLKTRGYSPVVVEENGLFKVRVGSYRTRTEASAAIQEIKAKLGGSPFVVTES